jgi:hypothetical protein
MMKQTEILTQRRKDAKVKAMQNQAFWIVEAMVPGVASEK